MIHIQHIMWLVIGWSSYSTLNITKTLTFLTLFFKEKKPGYWNCKNGGRAACQKGISFLLFMDYKKNSLFWIKWNRVSPHLNETKVKYTVFKCFWKMISCIFQCTGFFLCSGSVYTSVLLPLYFIPGQSAR